LWAHFFLFQLDLSPIKDLIFFHFSSGDVCPPDIELEARFPQLFRRFFFFADSVPARAYWSSALSCSSWTTFSGPIFFCSPVRTDVRPLRLAITTVDPRISFAEKWCNFWRSVFFHRTPKTLALVRRSVQLFQSPSYPPGGRTPVPMPDSLSRGEGQGFPTPLKEASPEDGPFVYEGPLYRTGKFLFMIIPHTLLLRLDCSIALHRDLPRQYSPPHFCCFPSR